MSGNSWRRLAGAMIVVGLTGCGPVSPPPPLERERSASAGTVTGELPRLEVGVGSQTTDGGILKLRGTVRNPLPKTVDGVRLVFYLLSRPGVDATRLETLQHEMSVTLAPAQSTALRWDIESIYFGSDGGFGVLAYPKRVDGEDQPLPPDWRQ
jgi:hypothetical protein